MGIDMPGLTLAGQNEASKGRILCIDSISIDKSSSAELSEAINSMFAWYKNSGTCYAYLSDVEWTAPTFNQNWTTATLGESRWFKRGWTLQELIAPRSITFFAANWKPLGTKLQLCKSISTITRISLDALLGKPLTEFNVGEKMSWAAGRQTTRVEDVAYSLLGMFGINMPLLYGEGENAYFRLQEMIIEMSEDYTIFAWSRPVRQSPRDDFPFLASCPDEFNLSSGEGGTRDLSYSQLAPIVTVNDSSETGHRKREPPSVTSRGIKMVVPYGHASAKDPNLQNDFIALCCIDSKGSSSHSWLCLDIMRSEGATVAVTRPGEALHIVKNVPRKFTEIYGARRIAHDDAMASSEHRTRVLWQTLMQDLLHKLPSTNAVKLARRLKDYQWCSSCCTYARSDCMQGEDEPCDHCSFRIAHQSLEDRYSGSGSGDDAAIEGPGFDEEVSLGSPLWSTERGSRFACALDSQLFILQSSLSTISQDLPEATLKVLLCCMVWMAANQVAIRKETRLGKFQYFLRRRFRNFVSTVLFTSVTPGIFALRMSLRDRTETYIRHEARYNQDSASLAHHILGCCQILAGTTEDKFVAEVAQALSYVDFEDIQEWTLRRPEEVVEAFRSRLDHRPPNQMVEEFANWLESNFRSMLRVWGPIDVNDVLKALECICEYAQYGIVPGIADDLTFVVRLMMIYCANPERNVSDEVETLQKIYWDVELLLWERIASGARLARRLGSDYLRMHDLKEERGLVSIENVLDDFAPNSAPEDGSDSSLGLHAMFDQP